jgi:hypothetical protein
MRACHVNVDRGIYLFTNEPKIPINVSHCLEIPRGPKAGKIISFAHGPQVANVMYGLVEHLFEHNHSGR